MNIKNWFRFRKPIIKKLTRDELVAKAARGSAYAIRKHGGALDKLAQYDRS